MIHQLKWVTVALATLATFSIPVMADTLSGRPPIVIGHRGASGYRPEHTLEAYELAIEMGANYIEPDLVSTKDGILIARHENEISGTTDVSTRPEFASRKTSKVIDGVTFTGWFAEDFTLAEIKTLRAKERLPQFRSTAYDGLYLVPTLQEVIDLAAKKSAEKRRPIGIYPETKHPTYHDGLGLSLEEPLVKLLVQNRGKLSPFAPVFIQSFETANLKEIGKLVQQNNLRTKVRIVQLLGGASDKPYDFVVKKDPRTYGDLAKPSGLAEIATYANGIGPFKQLIVPAQTVDANSDGKPDDLNGDGVISDADRVLLKPTTLVNDAHNAGLLVHPYTFRNEAFFLAPSYTSPLQEYGLFYSLGVDGLFSDFPDTAVQAKQDCIVTQCYR
jgi:glycerophosphoryl diester phosphodiesterase